jgi:hypothetical protein
VDELLFMPAIRRRVKPHDVPPSSIERLMDFLPSLAAGSGQIGPGHLDFS